MNDDYRIISSNTSESSSSSNNDAMLQELARLNATSGKMLDMLSKMSQTNARDARNDTAYSPFRDKYRNDFNTNGISLRNIEGQLKRGLSKTMDDFLDGFEAQVLGSITGGVQSRAKRIAADFAKDLGIEMSDIPKFLGKSMGQVLLSSSVTSRLANSFKKNFEGVFDNMMKGFMDNLEDEPGWIQDYFKDLFKRGNNPATRAATSIPSGSSAARAGSNVAQTAQGVQAANTSLAGLAGNAKVGAAAIKGLAGAISKAGPLAGYVAAAIAIIKLVKEKIIDPAIMGIEALVKFVQVADRYSTSRKKNLEYQQQRIKEDINTVILEPFNILKDAAQQVYNAWDANVRLITATQGYDKAGLQDLVGDFAERLRDEGLTDVISSTSILENLSKVLGAGLSGNVAEEFAYQATKLGAAIPTQDFFSFAATYSSVAANAVAAGKSNSEAIAEANQSLYEFANNLLYASRELSGGFTTGLQDASSLYSQTVRISQAAKTGNTSEIGGVLTAVAGIVGAIAPDLATSLTDAVYSAATGGNSSSIVALRSLAGVNASNTEFLKALASDPKKVFTNIFSNLATMFGSSQGAYMEAAEGYAEIFGLSSESFQRIDFEYLAQAIDKMNTNSGSLVDNMELLASGQTTLTKEQLVTRQINQYMIDEGLAYVLDNEAARAIQEHMWDEQSKRELMEATYGVDIVGGALQLFESIATSINNILMILNPIQSLEKVYNTVLTLAEGITLTEDVKTVLRQGRVGTGNATDYQNLITSGRYLKLTEPLAEMLGGVSGYRNASAATRTVNALGNLGHVLSDNIWNVAQGASSAYGSAHDFMSTFVPRSSKYNWGTVSKSAYRAAQSQLGKGSVYRVGPAGAIVSSGTSQAKFQSALDALTSEENMASFKGKSYEDWIASAGKDFVSSAEEYGITESDLKNYYQTAQAQFGAQEEQRIREDEQNFRDTGRNFWTVDFIDYRDHLIKEQAMVQWTSAAESLVDIKDVKLTESGDIWKKLQDLHINFQDGGTTYNQLDNIYNTQFQFYTDARNTWIKHIENINSNISRIEAVAEQYAKYYLSMTFSKGALIADSKSIMQELKDAEKSKDNGALVYALAQALTQNTQDLSKPQDQTNALLAQILNVVSAILTQSGNSAGSLSLADTLSALAMGVTTKA